MHRLVRWLILEPDTPGGLRPSMAWRLASRSATADDIVVWYSEVPSWTTDGDPGLANTIGAQQTSGPSDGVTLEYGVHQCLDRSRATTRQFWRGDDTISRYGLRLAQTMVKVESTPSYPTTRKPEPRLRRNSQARPPGWTWAKLICRDFCVRRVLS